jgi:hypothetical protein
VNALRSRGPNNDPDNNNADIPINKSKIQTMKDFIYNKFHEKGNSTPLDKA